MFRCLACVYLKKIVAALFIIVDKVVPIIRRLQQTSFLLEFEGLRLGKS